MERQSCPNEKAKTTRHTVTQGYTGTITGIVKISKREKLCNLNLTHSTGMSVAA